MVPRLGAVHILRQPPEGGGGVSQILTIAIADGGGVQEPLILADVICEQPLKNVATGQRRIVTSHHFFDYFCLAIII